MNRILFFTLSLVMAITAYGQNPASVDTLQTGSDSTSVGSHAEFSAARQESNVTKAEGDSAYIRNDYASAIQIYENLLKKGEAAEVYYNLGNSYYKADDIAKAILNYERALLLEPGNADIRANLEIARSKTIDKVIPVPEVFFVSWTKSLINCLSVDAWAKLGIVFFVLLLVSFYLFFFSKQIMGKKVGFIAGIVFLPDNSALYELFLEYRENLNTFYGGSWNPPYFTVFQTNFFPFTHRVVFYFNFTSLMKNEQTCTTFTGSTTHCDTRC